MSNAYSSSWPEGKLAEAPARRSSFQKLIQALAILGTVALFLAAKHIATGLDVTFDQFQYWLVGLVPIVCWHGFGQSALRIPAAYATTVWAISLLLFILGRVTYISEPVEYDAQDIFGYRTMLGIASLALIYSMTATAITTGMWLIVASPLTKLWIGVVAVLNFVFFALLVIA